MGASHARSACIARRPEVPGCWYEVCIVQRLAIDKEDADAAHYGMLDRGARRRCAHEGRNAQSLRLSMRAPTESSECLITAFERYADLFMNAPFAYVVLDRDVRVRDANVAASDMLGWPVSRLIGQSFAQWITREQIGRFSAHIAESCRCHTAVGAEFRIDDRNGRRHHVCVRCRSAIDGATGERYFRLMLFDMSQQAMPLHRDTSVHDAPASLR